MNLVKIGCNEVSVHLDMFITNHVYIRRFSTENIKSIGGTTIPTSNVRLAMDHNIQQNQHQDLLNNRQQQLLNQVGDGPDGPDLPVDHIDLVAIEEVAERMKELGDQFLLEHQNPETPAYRISSLMEKYIPRLVIGGFAVYTVYKCVRK